MTAAAREAAYDNFAATPDAAAQRARRLARSAAFRQAHPEHLDVPYRRKPRQRWDLFPGDPRAPCLIFIHGGYWQFNDHAGFAFVAEGLTALGWSAALPGYTLAPDAALPEIVSEIGAALDWLADNHAFYGIGGPVVLAGWSAGATLALLHAQHRLADRLLLISGIYELAPLRDTSLNGALALDETTIAACSPLRHELPPVAGAVTVGTGELPALVANSQAIASHLPGVTLAPIPGADHFSILDGLADACGPVAALAATLANPGLAR
jgi:acetyl esterase/lipase